jgi:hypothetical protein
VVYSEWSSEILRVNFGGAASDLAATNTDEKTGKQAYCNRVSELWWTVKEFVHSDQVRGLSKEAAREFLSRKYEERKGADGLRIQVETKPDMKLRLGKSPDTADACVGLLELCRQRLGAQAGGYGALKRVASRSTWSDWARQSDMANDLEAIGAD